MKRGLPSNLIAAATAVGLDANGAPATRVKLLPIGTITMRDGRGPYQVADLAHAQAVVAATREWLGGVDYAFDYDHQTVFGAKPGVGGKAKASGWVKPENITAEADGIYANDVEWTPAAHAALVAREYRYVSPVFNAGPDNRVSRLKNAALTISPAIDLPAIAASHFGEDMPLTAIAAALGLPATADEATILAAITKPSTSTIAIAAGLAATATAEEIAAAVTEQRGKVVDLSLYVPKDIVADLQEEVKKIRTDRITGKVDTLVAAGVIPPTKREKALKWFTDDEVAATEFYDGMPAIVKPGAKEPGSKSDPITTLTDEDLAACAMTGLSHEAYLKAKNEDVA